MLAVSSNISTLQDQIETVLDRPTNVSRLWESVKDEREIASFGNFILSLDYLFAVGAIDYERGLLIRSDP